MTGRDFALKLALLRFFVADAIQGWYSDVWRADMDATYCCDGNPMMQCGCQGISNLEMWQGVLDDYKRRPR